MSVAAIARAEAIRLGRQSKAAAYLALAAAAPADDTAMQLFEQGAKPPRGKRLPPDASVRAVQHAAKGVPSGSRRRRGRTTTPEERAVGDAIRHALYRAGVQAKVDVVATVPLALLFEGRPRQPPCAPRSWPIGSAIRPGLALVGRGGAKPSSSSDETPSGVASMVSIVGWMRTGAIRS